jgi:hypothetical protein
MPNRTRLQQKSASAFGGVAPTSDIRTPKTGTIAPWQMADNYDPRFSGVRVQQPQAPGGPAASPVSNLMQQVMGMYPETPTTPQPLQGGYGSAAWNILGPLGGAGMADAGGAPAQITTGITQPEAPAAPVQPSMGGLPDWVDPAAAQANFGQSMEPAFMKLLASYYPSAAGLQGGFEQARANAGLGWGGLQTGQQGNLLRFLQGLV